ncbi:MAG: hypothetical protein N2B02_05375 [Amylibacter sp.]
MEKTTDYNHPVKINTDDQPAFEHISFETDQNAPVLFETQPFEPQEFNMGETTEKKKNRVNLDRWLWAARFFATAAIAKRTIEKGHIQYNGAKFPDIKANQPVDIGGEITISPPDKRRTETVVITGLSTRRRNAADAEGLYQTVMQPGNTHAQPTHDKYNRQHQDKDKQPSSTSSRFLRRSMRSKKDEQQPSHEAEFNFSNFENR